MEEFHQMINIDWDASTKLEFLKTGLRTVVGECIKARNKKERDELDYIQKQLIQKMFPRRPLTLRGIEANKVEIDALFAKRDQIMESRSESLALKARTKWFYEGERSNKYFLNMLRKKNLRAEIDALEINSVITKDEEVIKNEVSSYYKNLYENGQEIDIDQSFYANIDVVPERVSAPLTMEITKDELYDTLKTCSDSAPGPDGIPYSYYKTLWYIFGDIIVDVWKESIAQNRLPPSHRSSILKLLPKHGKDLTKLTNWRPITLSNCDHKLITKCYARRLTKALQPYIHPNQMAYLPGKQMQDNLRIINIINKNCDDSIIAALDAKKAFDSVNHEYIRVTLRKYGLSSFVPIFDLLYTDQKVEIALNGDIIEGYKIGNGVKQGDSLILFIICIDPLIRNIESNTSINRIELGDNVLPKVVAYADDITCLTNSKRSVRYTFKEYERLSKSSGLMLNADKTEILDKTSSVYKLKSMNNFYEVRGLEEAKINGVVFHRDDRIMREKNYEMLVNKINVSLSQWRARPLSLLGKILIYKTFGLSQITYLLTVIELNEAQLKQIDRMYYNYLWGRDLGRQTFSNRISKYKLCLPITMGGFGMIDASKVIEGIRCRQLGKMFDTNYNHPLKNLILNENRAFTSKQCLNEYADLVAVKAQTVILKNFAQSLKKMTNDQIVSDILMLQQLGTVETVTMVKERKRDSIEMITLVHFMNCSNLRDIVIQCHRDGRLLRLCKKLLQSKFVRIVQLLTQRNIAIQPHNVNKVKLVNGTYKNIELVTSMEFRHLLQGNVQMATSRFRQNLDDHTLAEYFKQIKKLPNTRHKNTLLRVWNGDCLSNSRLLHLGIAYSNACPNCGEYDTPEHMLFDCVNSRRVWELLMDKIPRPTARSIMHYAIGINDSKTFLMVKAELLKYIMHFRDLDPEVKLRRALTYLKAVNKNNPVLANL
jgi:hypothetical protein